jgi:hypothetical protein
MTPVIWDQRQQISGVRRRSIQNTFKDIPFSDASELEAWPGLSEFKTDMGCCTHREREAEAMHFEPGGFPRPTVAER